MKQSGGHCQVQGQKNRVLSLLYADDQIKECLAPFALVESPCLKWRSLDHFEGRMAHEINRQTVSGSSNVVDVPVCCGEEGAELKDEAVNLPLDLHSSSHLWT